MLRREDLNRQPPPSGMVPINRQTQVVEVSLQTIAAGNTEGNAKAGPDSIILLLATEPSIAVVLRSQEEADELISKLLSLRNHLWP